MNGDAPGVRPGVPGDARRAADAGLAVVGIGASAGGLEAVLTLVARLAPCDTLAIVLAQHMSNDAHADLVVRLIQRETDLFVRLAEDGMPLSSRTLYVIPAGRNGRVRDGRLRLETPDPAQSSKPSVDVLFRSIAEACAAHAIGIVLSGTGVDGVAGCRALQAAGGLTMAQDPAEARFDGMPRAAIDAGTVDRTLTAGSIGQLLATMFPGVPGAQRPNDRRTATMDHAMPGAGTPPEPAEPPELRALLGDVLQATGVDFSGYKAETLLRRLEQRKAALGAPSLQVYRARVRERPDELRHLQNLFLVTVSSFFRDAESFAVLERALAQRIARKPPGEAVRVWVPGCACGEEAYTLAIILHDLTGGDPAQHPIVIHATDLSAEAIALARAGCYGPAALAEMPPERRTRHLTARDGGFEVKPHLKACVRFERADILQMSLPGGLDLVSCRNVLIYMKTELQERLVRIFHHCLSPGGLLFIGSAESLRFTGAGLFTALDDNHRLYVR